MLKQQMTNNENMFLNNAVEEIVECLNGHMSKAWHFIEFQKIKLTAVTDF